MSTKNRNSKINPYLLDRLHAISAAFASDHFAHSINHSISEMSSFDGSNNPKPAKDWRDLLQDDGDDREGGGGGTIRGLRGKNAAHAMRTLKRGR